MILERRHPLSNDDRQRDDTSDFFPAEVDPPDEPARSEVPPRRANPDPGDEFRSAFSPSVKEAMVSAVQRAYAHVQDSHDESVGFNAQTFGYSVYHLGRFELEKLCKASDGQLARVEDVGALFRVQNGPYRLGFYKVGHSASEDIWQALPSSEHGGVSGDKWQQLPLAGIEEQTVARVEDLRYAVVAHLGNPEDGLCAVYLCLPLAIENGRITGWVYAEPIFIRDTSAVHVPAPLSSTAPELPQEEPEEEVIVRPKGAHGESTTHDRSR